MEKSGHDEREKGVIMGYQLSKAKADGLFQQWAKKYDIFAPVHAKHCLKSISSPLGSTLILFKTPFVAQSSMRSLHAFAMP